MFARMARYGPTPSGTRSAARMRATGQNGSSRHVTALFDSSSSRINEQSSRLLICGFGVRVPGGALAPPRSQAVGHAYRLPVSMSEQLRPSLVVLLAVVQLGGVGLVGLVLAVLPERLGDPLGRVMTPSSRSSPRCAATCRPARTAGANSEFAERQCRRPPLGRPVARRVRAGGRTAPAAGRRRLARPDPAGRHRPRICPAGTPCLRPGPHRNPAPRGGEMIRSNAARNQPSSIPRPAPPGTLRAALWAMCGRGPECRARGRLRRHRGRREGRHRAEVPAPVAGRRHHDHAHHGDRRIDRRVDPGRPAAGGRAGRPAGPGLGADRRIGVLHHWRAGAALERRPRGGHAEPRPRSGRDRGRAGAVVLLWQRSSGRYFQSFRRPRS
jgi:hypothetical protein